MIPTRLGRVAALFLVVGTYLFLYIPIVVLTLFSFNKGKFPAPWTGFTLHWYRELWLATDLIEAFKTSLIVASVATVLSLTMGILLIFYLMHGGARARKMLSIFYVNLVIPEVVLAVGLLSLFSFFQVELGLRTLIIAHTVLAMGYVVPTLYQKYCTIEPYLIDVSLDLGATMWQTFRRVILPLVKPSVVAAGLLVFVISFDDFVISYFCSGGSSQTLSLSIFAMLRSGISPVVNALSTLLLAASSVLVMLFCYYNVRSKLL